MLRRQLKPPFAFKAVPAYGYAIIRFIPHPGMWFFHCHISWHAEAGLGMQIQYRPDLVKVSKTADLKQMHYAFSLNT